MDPNRLADTRFQPPRRAPCLPAAWLFAAAEGGGAGAASSGRVAAGAAGAGLKARANLLEWVEGAQGGGKQASALHLEAAPPFPARELRDFTALPPPLSALSPPFSPPAAPTNQQNGSQG